MLEKLDFADNY